MSLRLLTSMTSFGWKRKIGEKVSQSASEQFSNESRANDDTNILHDVDVAIFNPKHRRMQLEDAVAKCHRLKQEGTTLADAERYWEALKKWDEAIQLIPNDETLHEMKAQVLLILHEVFPAVEAASKAVSLNPKWWIAYQTLGRVHLGIGEVRMAIKSFSKAVHIKPDDKELRNEDLLWACNLLEQKHKSTDELEQENTQNELTITEIDESNAVSQDNPCDTESVLAEDTEQKGTFISSTCKLRQENEEQCDKQTSHVNRLPKGYILMRDK